MTNIHDFKGTDGAVDWDAYRKAQREAGEICQRCSKYLMPQIFGPTVSGPRSCGSCQSLDEDSGPVRSDDFIRCPFCRHQWDPAANEDGVFGEGDFLIACPECDREFEITTEVTYTFISPELEPKEKNKP